MRWRPRSPGRAAATGVLDVRTAPAHGPRPDEEQDQRPRTAATCPGCGNAWEQEAPACRAGCDDLTWAWP